jgi:dihydroorotate dehydrogenase (NAD+) catalytic subunit
MGVDMRVELGALKLPNPVVAASGTFGHGDEVARLCDPAELGAVTAKSQAVFAWPGNAAPRLYPVTGGMLNAVGLEGRGIDHWLAEELPALDARGARVIASIWGREIDDFRQAAARLRDAKVVAVEVNLSCPNVEHHSEMFAHDPDAVETVMRAVTGEALRVPTFAKLSPNVTDIVAIAAAASRGGADGLTLVNTVLGLAIDARTRRPALGRGVGGLSGPAIKPIALRAVAEVHRAMPEVAIIGTGGVSTAEDAVEMLLAGASAVGVGTATFADPRAPRTVLRRLERWCGRNGVSAVRELTGALENS